jgi:carbonic anhydrase
MDAQTALEKLQEGNNNYVDGKLTHPNTTNERRDELAGGQAPFAIVLSCADSRVVPELIFDQGMGDLFTVRVAGNVANASSIASIEYAVAHLGTRLVLVMGHESCGAVTAAIQGVKESPSLDHLLTQIEEAVDSAASSDVNTVVKENAKVNAQRLLNNSEILRDTEDLLIVSAYYNLSTGAVDFIS